MYDDLLGVNWKFNGRDKDGIDCWGLAIEVYKRNGRVLPEFNVTEDKSETIQQLVSQEIEFAEKLEQPEPFCFVTFAIGTPYVNHIGIVLEDRDQFIHILRGSQVSIERLSRMSWGQRSRGFFRWKKS